MAKQRILHFPEGFLWGTASSSHQCEGGNINNQWYRWEQQGHILTGEASGIADNWWENAERDFNLAEQMENNALRLSLEWSRIEPAEGRWDSAALDRYRQMLTNLRRRHMKPIVTLHHFTEPLWFADRGGFAKEANIRFFVRYATYAVQILKDLCDFWVTINEPNVYASQGYVIGSSPPGERDIIRASQVLCNLVQAHVQAFYAIRRLQPEGQIGYCLHYRLFDPANRLSPLDSSAAGLQDTFFNWAALKAMETGKFTFPLNMLLAPVVRAEAARDYHGVNYYTREMVRFDPALPAELFGRRFVRPGATCNDPGLDNNFGLIEVDQQTQRRIPRPSASMYGEICRANAITESLVDRYAPEAAGAIFGKDNVAQYQVPV